MSATIPLRPDTADSLAFALVAASEAPILLLDVDCRVLVASASFSGAFALEQADTIGRPLFSLGEGEWDVPQ
jgi:hypothetical protein